MTWRGQRRRRCQRCRTHTVRMSGNTSCPPVLVLTGLNVHTEKKTDLRAVGANDLQIRNIQHRKVDHLKNAVVVQLVNETQRRLLSISPQDPIIQSDGHIALYSRYLLPPADLPRRGAIGTEHTHLLKEVQHGAVLDG